MGDIGPARQRYDVLLPPALELDESDPRLLESASRSAGDERDVPRTSRPGEPAPR